MHKAMCTVTDLRHFLIQHILTRTISHPTISHLINPHSAISHQTFYHPRQFLTRYFLTHDNLLQRHFLTWTISHQDNFSPDNFSSDKSPLDNILKVKLQTIFGIVLYILHRKFTTKSPLPTPPQSQTKSVISLLSMMDVATIAQI